MILALSTHWNAHRHSDGEALVDDVLELGFGHIELGYDLTMDLVPGIRKAVDGARIRVDSVHNFCPVPAGAPRGHPELYALTDLDRTCHDLAVRLTLDSARFAADIGATRLVVHAGNVVMRHRSRDLAALCAQHGTNDPRCEKLRLKMLAGRDKRAGRHLDQLRRGLDALLPACAGIGMTICLENLPSWESIPTEIEMASLLDTYRAAGLRCWHDTGHARIRQNLGFIQHAYWMKKLSADTAGLHVHDVAFPDADHLMPPEGDIDFAALRPAVGADTLAVIEPAPGMPATAVAAGRRFLLNAWEDAEAHTTP
jgi:sugar phosphate isomerase/epimerase